MPLTESRREKYAQQLYDYAESIKAKAILEVGLGWLISGHAFAESLANRPPGRLVSIELDNEKSVPLPQSVVDDFKARGVSWSVLRGDGMTLPVAGKFDLLYLDGPCSKDGLRMAWDNLARNVRKGGLVVIDGAGSHMERQGEPGITDFLAAMKSKGFSFSVSDYIKDCGHAVAAV